MMLARLLTQFDPNDAEHVVVSMTAGGAVARQIAAQGIRLIALDMRPGRANVVQLLKLVRILRTIRPDILQTWLYQADFVGLVVGTIARVPAVVWNIRCSEVDLKQYSWTLPLLLRFLALTSRWPAAIVCNSASGRSVHERLGYRPRRWALIPNGLDPDTFKPCPAARSQFRNELGVADSVPLVGLVARMDPMKDHPTFLRAAAVVAARQADARFVVAGRGVAESDMLRDLGEKLGIAGRVHLLRERQDVPRVLAAFDVAVSSSDSEGFPNMVLEAMACGTPCVVTDAGDSAAIVADTGVVVPRRDPEALADGIIRVLSMKADDREILTRAARTRVLQEYSLDRAAVRYQELYRELSAFRTGQSPCVG